MLNFAIKFFQDGGLFMYPILVISIIALAIVVERLYLLALVYNINGKAFIEKIKKFILEDRLTEAVTFCKGLKSALPQVVYIALENFHESERKLQNSIDEAVLEIIPKIERRLHYLAMLANVATLTGLLGTIQGLIQAFAAVGKADPSQKAALLASGISIAMNTTAYGLIVAVPCIVAYSYLQSRAKKIIDEMDLYSVMIVNMLMEKKVETNKNK